jgi:hypothetical protein
MLKLLLGVMLAIVTTLVAPVMGPGTVQEHQLLQLWEAPRTAATTAATASSSSRPLPQQALQVTPTTRAALATQQLGRYRQLLQLRQAPDLVQKLPAPPLIRQLKGQAEL